MGILTNQEKTRIRNILESKVASQSWAKAAVNDAAQAIEDFLVDNASAVSATINTASAPHGVTFTAPQKKILVAAVLYVKFLRDA